MSHIIIIINHHYFLSSPKNENSVIVIIKVIKTNRDIGHDCRNKTQVAFKLQLSFKYLQVLM